MSGSQTQTETRINRDRFKRAELTNVDESCSMSPPPNRGREISNIRIISDKPIWRNR
ncbi:hypothetical protein [Candidatus Endomicrobiellum trichonymphae]|uniref:hypothetical protein n=1 Tax=Endomicrobium trichonymphae TaxID=1408204 RepID=UPI0039B959D4